MAYEAIDFWIIICCFAYWRQNTNHFLTGIRTEMMLKLADIYVPIFCFFSNCEIYSIRKNSMSMTPSKYTYLSIPADLFNYKSFQVSQERIWWMTDFSPTIIIFPVKEIVMGVNPQKIDTLLALCANSNQKAAKNSKAAMLFDKFWHFVKILRLYKQTVYDLRSLWIIESSRNVVIF